MDEELAKYMASGKRAIPGQSLTNNPDQPYPFEKAPEFTQLRDALEFMFYKFTEQEFYIPAIQNISEGVPIMEIVQLALFTGFSEGKWNPDLMMLLMEPCTYMLMALAERAGISDYTIYPGEEEEEAAEEEVLGTRGDRARLQRLKESRDRRVLPKGVLPPEIEQRLEQVQPPEEGLMSPPQEDMQPMQEEQPSLLGG